MSDNSNSGYYAAGYETPLLTGDEPEPQHPATPEFSEEEATIRPDEDAEAYLARLEVLATAKASPPARNSRPDEADQRWLEQYARASFAARGIERPTPLQRKGAYVQGAALLAGIRRPS